MASENADEEYQLLQIFPNEVWGMVLENVKEIKDYHKICDASPQLRVRFLRLAPIILFPVVAKVLLFKNVHFPQWIKVRQICRTWKQEVDKLLQKTPDYFIQHDDDKLYEMSGIAFNENDPGLQKRFSFRWVQHFAKFEEHFDPTHLTSGANPFVHRKIYLYIDDVNGPPENYYAACTRFLEKYGKHLWFCIIAYEFEDRNSLNDFYKRRLPTLLEHMPNLRAFQMQLLRYLEDGNDIEVEAAPVRFPTLPRLEYISIDSGCPCAVVGELLAKNSQVRYVNAQASDWMPIFLHLLPNLRAATFRIEDENILGLIEEARFTNSRLERLWLLLLNLRNKSGLVFQTLERHFSENLVELHLNLSSLSAITASDRLMLPYLKIFHLEMEEHQRLDFLLPMKDTLEELHFSLEQKPNQQDRLFECPKPGQDKGSIIQVYKFWKEPQKSNVWSVFPKLRVLKIKWFRGEGEMPEKYRCTRNEWRAVMGGKEKN